MKLRKAALKNSASMGAEAFPPEAGMHYGEVDQAEIDAMKKAFDSEFEGEEWELLDGLNFPYGKVA